jgi:hypothetical protein
MPARSPVGSPAKPDPKADATAERRNGPARFLEESGHPVPKQDKAERFIESSLVAVIGVDRMSQSCMVAIQSLADEDVRLERRRMGLWFGILYVFGPLTAFIVHGAKSAVVLSLPIFLRPWIRFAFDATDIWGPIMCGGFGAAYCLARACGQTSRDDIIASTIAFGIVVAVSYFLLLFLGSLAYWMINMR